MPDSTVGRIERGAVSPTAQTIERLVEALGGRASFGSAARGQDTSGSDIDVMVDLEADADLLALARLERDLSELLGVDVDVVPRSAMTAGMRRVADAEAVPA